MSFIIALDTDMPRALEIVGVLSPERHVVKVGLPLFTIWPEIVPTLRRKGFNIFLDLVYCGTPDMVAKACRAATDLGVAMVSIHIGSGMRVLKAAVEAIASVPNRPIIIGTTVFTHATVDDFLLLGITKTIPEITLRCACIATQCGLDGVMCSPIDVSMLRADHRTTALRIVCPAIRMPEDLTHDHAHCVLPSTAIAWGCDDVVVGRPITEARDPLAALERYEADIRATHRR